MDTNKLAYWILRMVLKFFQCKLPVRQLYVSYICTPMTCNWCCGRSFFLLRVGFEFSCQGCNDGLLMSLLVADIRILFFFVFFKFPYLKVIDYTYFVAFLRSELLDCRAIQFSLIWVVLLLFNSCLFHPNGWPLLVLVHVDMTWFCSGFCCFCCFLSMYCLSSEWWTELMVFCSTFVTFVFFDFVLRWAIAMSLWWYWSFCWNL